MVATWFHPVCQDKELSADNPWTCPGDRILFDASFIWGLVGQKRIFRARGNYGAVNWFFLIGGADPVIVYIFHRIFPSQKWILMINLPVLIGATANMPPAKSVNYNVWLIIGIILNFFMFRYHKKWWQRYNYGLSATLDAGISFMAVLLYFTLTMENRSVNWWGMAGEHCPLATCPTAKGIDLSLDPVETRVCPVF
jgi:OPT family oligopeptide transporter